MDSIPVKRGRKSKSIEITPEYREYMKNRKLERNRQSAKASRDKAKEYISILEANSDLLSETVSEQKRTIELQAKFIREMQIEIDELKKRTSICSKCVDIISPIFAEVIDHSEYYSIEEWTQFHHHKHEQYKTIH